MSRGTVIVLGCGNSTGVPAIGNIWGDCDPQEPKNTRTRSSICIQADGKTLIVDTGPDFRAQINRENIPSIDAVLYTHDHGDHVHGIDDLRVLKYKQQQNIDIYSNAETLTRMREKFFYLFDGGANDLYPPVLTPHVIETYGQAMNMGGVSIIPFEQDHATCKTVGYRIGDFAYSTDVWQFDDDAIETLKGIKTWIVDSAAYTHENNSVHLNLQSIYKYNERIQAERVYLTSMTLSMDYQTLCNELPDGYEPCYDGMRLEFEF